MLIPFLYSVAGGMLAVLGLARLTDIAWKFIRLVGLLTLALCVLPTVWVYREGTIRGELGCLSVWECGLLASLGAIALVILAPLVIRVPRTLRVICICAGAMAVAAACLLTRKALHTQGAAPDTGFLVAGQILSSWLLGSITVAWLLGHAYLTATKMTIAPLRFFTGMLSAAVLARVAFFVVALSWAWLSQTGSPPLATRLEQWWLILTLRVGVGLVAVPIFAYMVRDCVRLRSTQSATGILYFASVMAYVGELASQYLTRELGWPL